MRLGTSNGYHERFTTISIANNKLTISSLQWERLNDNGTNHAMPSQQQCVASAEHTDTSVATRGEMHF
eukprot:m.1373842 g.1373842  ORF g.1373842 m.1373842 type:complete len:68 (+) comp24958_c0_seq2:2910-3113(+)